MLTRQGFVDSAESSTNGRHPIWMFIGLIIGLAAAVGGMAITEWIVPGAAGSQSLLFPVITAVMGAALFRRGVQGVHPAWPLVGFPLLVATVVFLSGLVRPTVTSGSTSPIVMLLVTFVLVSIWYVRSRQHQATPQTVRRELLRMVVILAILLAACVALSIAAYSVPWPTVRAAVPAAAASAFGVWFGMALVAVAWVLHDRLSLASEPTAS
ncbi:MAG TPA: hypothetical protein VF777_09505 [Phycisphaerales bacterium]